MSKSSFVVLVTGGRDFDERAFVFGVLDAIHATRGPIGVVVHGGARGADSIAGEWANDRGTSTAAIPAQWEKHGRAAGPKRNQAMVDLVVSWHELGDEVVVVAFPGGAGTADCVRRAREAGFDVLEASPGELFPEEEFA